ncbi:hypothetical protein GCM10007897_15320 [Sphingobium jiangsuense]|uniref:Uncharacterized protein n=1 Tax=Sphingobium jiangsuense TaxID=870476 RepID=A0A7W6BHK6_9SPHN|nr:hypothetical protein [Sphingobium jiangsuense]MBB3925022.1 hypothetical protein [Sphingobium jiangsuense]GLT00148.1 hypothetical protein GCM10007897_15320 [Sphingobium jiangsuense]
MARYSKDGLKIATNLFEAAAWHYTVKVICRCEHSATFDPHGLWYHFHRLGWDDDLKRACKCFWCRPCAHRFGRRVRPIRIELVREPPQISLPLPTDREWKRIVSRWRG